MLLAQALCKTIKLIKILVLNKIESVKKNEWFEDWFNSEYYHLLYQNRSQNEADLFIKKIVQNLKLDAEATVLDLGCGKGRHALKMSSFFKTVHGLDLSENNIKTANSYKKDNMKFFIGDMRNFNNTTSYDYIFNLFTSFGYFNTIEENLDVLKCIHRQLKKNGHLLMDFLNPEVIRNNKYNAEEKRINDVYFKIEKHISGNFIEKKIQIKDGNKQFHFKEKVQLFDINDFEEMFMKTGFTIHSTFGNYALENYHTNSERLILWAQKLN